MPRRRRRSYLCCYLVWAYGHPFPSLPLTTRALISETYSPSLNACACVITHHTHCKKRVGENEMMMMAFSNNMTVVVTCILGFPLLFHLVLIVIDHPCDLTSPLPPYHTPLLSKLPLLLF